MKPIPFFFLFCLSASPCVQAELTLEKTAIERAVINESITSYRKAWDKLNTLSFQEVSEILLTTDQNGNNLLHLMAGVKNSQKLFAREILRLSIAFIDIGAYDILENFNKQGLSPREVAKKAGNSQASKYLTEASNMIKNMRNRGDLDEKKTTTTSEEWRIEKQDGMFVRYNLATGAIVFLNGVIFLATGANAGDLGAILVGGAQMSFGGMACYKTFKFLKNNNKL